MDHTDGENEKKGKKVLFALTNVCVVLKNRSNAKCVERKPSQGDERANSNRISVCQLEIPDTKNEIKARSIEVVAIDCLPTRVSTICGKAADEISARK